MARIGSLTNHDVYACTGVQGSQSSAFVMVQHATELRSHDAYLEPRHDLKDISVMGFQYGTNSSGTAQLTLAILADRYDDEFAKKHHQQFKRDVLMKLKPCEPWVLHAAVIDVWRDTIDNGGE